MQNNVTQKSALLTKVINTKGTRKSKAQALMSPKIKTNNTESIFLLLCIINQKLPHPLLIIRPHCKEKLESEITIA